MKELLAMSDKKLSRNLDLVQAQIKLAAARRNTTALVKLQKWESEIIQARVLKQTKRKP